MAQNQRKRKQLFVDRHVQGALAVRVLFYWVVWLICVNLMLLCWRILTGPPQTFLSHLHQMWGQYGPALVASLILLPMMMVDIVRLSNRFAGPLIRLRRAMRALARGEHVDPIHFRAGDYWQDLADQFNAVVERVQGRCDAEGESHEEEPAGCAAD